MINVIDAPAIRKGEKSTKQIAYILSDSGEGLPELAILSEWRPTLERFRDVASFHVEEVITGDGFDGRGFMLHRSPEAVVKDGPDAESYYCTFISRNGQDDHCSCIGCQKHGHCKHLTVLRRVIENGLLEDPRHDPRPEPAPDLDAMAELSNMAGLVGYRPEAPF